MRKPGWESHHFPELSLSTGKIRQIFFTQISFGCSSERQESPFRRWPQGTITRKEQISPEILLQHSSQDHSSLALQRDFQPAMSAARPQLLPHSCVRGGKDMHWVWDMASCQGWGMRIWVRCGSRRGRQRGFPRAWERWGEEESVACLETNAK